MVALYLSYAVMGYVSHAATARSTLDQAKEAEKPRSRPQWLEAQRHVLTFSWREKLERMFFL